MRKYTKFLISILAFENSIGTCIDIYVYEHLGVFFCYKHPPVIQSYF